MTLQEAITILNNHGWLLMKDSRLFFQTTKVSIDYNDLLIISKYHKILEITRTTESFAVFVEAREWTDLSNDEKII